ncbi:MAG: hypothetical protein F4Y44_05505 [Chloroflexi bacterium]|nr:hypothetical protein [Chloroflexota bacterium]
MQKDFWRLLAWVMGFTALFIVVALGTIQFIIADVADAARIIQTIGILVAVCVGGVFAYQRLQVFRTFEPHLTISHKVSHRYIGDSYVHIDVTATLRNSSKVQVELREGFFLLQKIAPETDENVEHLYAQVFVNGEYEDIQWPTLERFDRTWEPSELIVEPGESHPETHEFIVSKDVQTVIYIRTSIKKNYHEYSMKEDG